MKRALACNPTKMWIDGKCFVIKSFQKKQKTQSQKGNIKQENSQEGLETSEDSACSATAETANMASPKYEISTNEDGHLCTSFRIPNPYCGKLLCFPHLSIKDLETNTKTTIIIPERKKHQKNQKQEQEESDPTLIKITGENEEDVVQARDELHSILSEIRHQYMAMQFVAIPTLSEEITENFNKFKEDILNGEKISGIEESIFQKSQKLHLTVAVFSLLDDTEMQEASQALQDYKDEILDPLIKKTGPLKIQVSGIDCMDSNLTKVNVLYANAKIIEETEEVNLQQITNGISDYFYHRGLMKKYQDGVKLHMTLINTKYRKTTPDSPNKQQQQQQHHKKKRWPTRESFDATSIMNKYKDYNFGTCQFDSVRLSLMSTTGDDGFYKSFAVVKLE